MCYLMAAVLQITKHMFTFYQYLGSMRYFVTTFIAEIAICFSTITLADKHISIHTTLQQIVCNVVFVMSSRVERGNLCTCWPSQI